VKKSNTNTKPKKCFLRMLKAVPIGTGENQPKPTIPVSFNWPIQATGFSKNPRYKHITFKHKDAIWNQVLVRAFLQRIALRLGLA
jgi:hypothetical protein